MNINPISFGIQHPITKDWKKGLMPEVKYDLYGIPIKKDRITKEHIVPVSYGGQTVTENLAIADRDANNERGTTPLMKVIDYEQLFDYLLQWVDVETPNIYGPDYIAGVMKTIGNVERHRKEWIA